MNTIAYSSDGIDWIGLGKDIFSTSGQGVAWNGTRFVAVGEGTNTIAYSSDGITWTPSVDSTNIFTISGYNVAGNPNIGAVIVDSVITLNTNILAKISTLDIVAENYYNTGYSNFSIDITGNS